MRKRAGFESVESDLVLLRAGGDPGAPAGRHRIGQVLRVVGRRAAARRGVRSTLAHDDERRGIRGGDQVGSLDARVRGGAVAVDHELLGCNSAGRMSRAARALHLGINFRVRRRRWSFIRRAAASRQHHSKSEHTE